MKNVKDTVASWDLKCVKFNGDLTNGYCVLVKDKNSSFEAWVELYIKDCEIICDWNKYIFYLNDDSDLFQKDMQENSYVFDICMSLATEYLEESNKIKQDNFGDWTYISNVLKNIKK